MDLSNHLELSLRSFTRYIHSKGFHQSQGDHTLFFKHKDNGKITALVFYVDDIILMGNLR